MSKLAKKIVDETLSDSTVHSVHEGPSSDSEVLSMNEIATMDDRSWLERFENSLDQLNKMMSRFTDHQVDFKVEGFRSKDNYFNLVDSNVFYWKDFGLLGAAIKSAFIYTYCNPSIRDEVIWFPIKLSWDMRNGGGNGGPFHDFSGAEVAFWYHQLSNTWSDRK